MAPAALSYREPGISTILVLSSFLFLANTINYVLDHILFCGLVGQILIGVAWGTPGGNWLSLDVQNAVTQLGYLGLILIVFEGGLVTDLKTLRSNFILSLTVAAIGTLSPIALSFALRGFVKITFLQAFAAGAALCSTSLGTTFTILSTSGLSQSRLGVVLSSAAMMDDIVGLVMSSIISHLSSTGDIGAIDVIRPLFVSLAFAIVAPLICIWIVRPLTVREHGSRTISRVSSKIQKIDVEGVSTVTYTAVLLAFVTASSYAGTSKLFAAYLAGACITWWDGLESRRVTSTITNDGSTSATEHRADPGAPSIDAPQPVDINAAATHASGGRSDESSKSSAGPSPSSAEPKNPRTRQISGVAIYERHFQPVVNTMLKPFFFASIGFSIPISRMFTGVVLWRGAIYSLLMIVAKLLCGICLIRFQMPAISIQILTNLVPKHVKACWPFARSMKSTTSSARTSEDEAQEQSYGPTKNSPAFLYQRHSAACRTNSIKASRNHPRSFKPQSLYPAAMLGIAMVARGEIGFLISSVAETSGLFITPEDGEAADLFLIVTWAILLCTILGPLAVGLLVRRVKRLQALERSQQTGKADPLGIWGVPTSS